MLLQVIDVAYPELPGTLEELLRDLVMQEVGGANVLDPYNTASVAMLMKDVRLVTAKVRAILTKQSLKPNSPWLPSRFSAVFEKASTDFLQQITSVNDHGLDIEIGTVGGQPFRISLTSLDGYLTIITGKKESGKSHLAKILVQGIAAKGGTVLVLDVNGEYSSLDRTVEGKPSHLASAIKVLQPGVNFKTSLREMGLKTFLDILEHVYGTPSTSLRELARIWRRMEKKGSEVCLENLMEVVEHEQLNEAVRDALLSRLQSIKSSGFVDEDASIDLVEILSSKQGGNVAVVDLSNLLSSVRRLVVEFLLSHLSSLLSQERLEPVFLLAEEAHLYLRETYWEDIITRMRHIGLFPIFVTNQPDTIPELVYRQSDNIFLFNFTNDGDLEKIARVSKIDTETVKTLVKKMPARHCLLMGRMVSDIPLMVKVKPSNLLTMGVTKRFFRNHPQKHQRIEERQAHPIA
ncbi:MAG: ATP-binding protein [Candidatus Caldarchaeum sp.]|uniref:ATP-binding protein n=1 Tax=Caldiarchaeum subterraneum TaxID=311458 RepID=A0A7C5LFB2_CALS0